MDVQPEQVTRDDRNDQIRARLDAELKRVTPEREVFMNNGDARPGCTNHLADGAHEAEIRFTDDARRAVLLHLADQVKHAITKLDRGTYGLCDGCGGKIEEERLEAIIYAAECCSCMRKKPVRRH